MKILIAIVAYNEEKNIAETVKDLQQHNFGYDIVLIDNGSSDRTAEIAKKMEIPVVAHCINTGSSAGTLKSYFLYAYKHDYDIVCQFDGDGQHVASELPKIIKPILDNKADYVIGSRFITRDGFQSSALRRLGISMFSWLDSMIVGYRITDITSGFRAYNRKVFAYFAKDYRHEVYDTSQLLLLSHFAGARIVEVPVVMQERKHGVSEYDWYNAVTFPIKGLITIMGVLLQIRKTRRFKHGLED